MKSKEWVKLMVATSAVCDRIPFMVGKAKTLEYFRLCDRKPPMS